MNKKALLIALVAASTPLATQEVLAEGARDAISIVGSSTVYPFSAAVAEQFGKKGAFKTPKVESTGTGGGIKLFCGGVGMQYPDIANASRAMKKSEYEACQKAGVKDITEIKIGFDGIVVAQSKKAKNELVLTRKEVFLALAKRVPDPKNPEGGELVENPYKTWSEINPSLPKTKIEIVVNDEQVDAVVDAILKAAATGAVGDGKVFVSSIDNAVRIRTGERGTAAIK